MIRDTLFNISLLQSFQTQEELPKILEYPSSVQLKRIIQTLNSSFDKNQEITKRIDILTNNLSLTSDKNDVDLSFTSIVKCNKIETTYKKLMYDLKHQHDIINVKNFHTQLPMILTLQNNLKKCKEKLLKYWILLDKETQKSLLNDIRIQSIFQDDINYCLDLFKLFKMKLDPELLADVYQETNKVLAKIGSQFFSFTDVDETIETKYLEKSSSLPKFLVPFVIYVGQLNTIKK
jgi:hypothetical protein